jgi:hypothetical protein
MLIGVLLGIVIGLALGPLIRSWISWREYLDASREARLHEELLRRMKEAPPPDEASAEDRFRPVHRA